MAHETRESAQAKRVVCVCSDLIFAAKITAAARAAGGDLDLLRAPQGLASALATPAAAVVVDLNAAGDDPVGLIRQIRSLTQPPPVIAYLSHVQTELAAAARAAGADEVLPRSALEARLERLFS